MSVTLQQIYLWALNEQERLETWQRVQPLTLGQRQSHECAAGAVRLLDAVLSDGVMLDRLKVIAARRNSPATTEKVPA